jgi:hypothetical protein
MTTSASAMNAPILGLRVELLCCVTLQDKCRIDSKSSA